VRNDNGELIPDRRGRYYRQWRDHIQTRMISGPKFYMLRYSGCHLRAPKLQPIETRLIMLQTGMRANMGIRISGPNLETLDEFATSLEPVMREVEGVRPASVFADRVVGKPYLEIDIDRQEIAVTASPYRTFSR
jgi:copper/silver efflux system protein